jgi:uncharacterized membrane protein YozB (DUF420 family)
VTFVHSLPTVNACLNALAAALLVAGWRFIRRKEVAAHKRCMLLAFATSTLFLVSYVAHKALVRTHTPFPGSGASRYLYYPVLVSHVLLAIAIVPLALTTIVHALRGRIDRHRRLARVTLPIWLYVSVTGVAVWWMLYSGTFGPKPGSGS